MWRRRPTDELTPREREVLALIRLGLTNEEIASRLDITVAGAKYHVSQILSKLGVATRDEAAATVAEAFQPRRRWWTHWPLWWKIGVAAAVATSLAVLGVITMGWDGESRELDYNLPDVAQAESGRGSTPTSPRPAGPSTASESATPTPSPVPTPPVPSGTSDPPPVETSQPATADQSPALTPTPLPTPACPGPEYQGQLPWNCVEPGDCSSQVSVSVTLDKSVYKSGEAVTMTLIAANNSPQSIVLCYADGQTFEIFVQSGGHSITHYSLEELVPYTQAVWNEQVPAGWNQTRFWSWDQMVGPPYEQGSPLAPGAYEIRGVWTANGCNGSTPDCPNSSPPVQFVVEP